ncbi:prohibitin family protein [Oceanobacillus oncorhynchi]|uniref:prohibitin family protein n=1 Tax=Oceanobacillus oncorhynchi TaxID=545501 RepID=UPI0034D6FB51
MAGSTKFKIGGIAVGLFLIGLLAVGIMSIYRVSPGYMGVVYSMNGGVQEETKTQGWHVVWPNQKVISYPVSTEMEEITIEAGTNDGKTVKMKVQYAYHMNPEMLPHVFTKFRGRTAEDIASSYINQQIRDISQAQTREQSVLGVYSQNTTEIIADIRDSLSEVLVEDGIALERFTISDVEPDEETLVTLQGIADAQNQQELLKREEANKEQEVINNKIAADGEKEVKLIEAQAEAESNELVQASITQQLIDYELAQKWDGQVSKVSGGAGSIVNLPESLLEDEVEEEESEDN